MLLINHNQSSNKTDCDFTKKRTRRKREGDRNSRIIQSIMTEFSKPSSLRRREQWIFSSFRFTAESHACTTGGVQLELLKGKVLVLSMSCFIITLRQIEEHFITFRVNEGEREEGGREKVRKKFHSGPHRPRSG